MPIQAYSSLFQRAHIYLRRLLNIFKLWPCACAQIEDRVTGTTYKASLQEWPKNKVQSALRAYLNFTCNRIILILECSLILYRMCFILAKRNRTLRIQLSHNFQTSASDQLIQIYKKTQTMTRKKLDRPGPLLADRVCCNSTSIVAKPTWWSFTTDQNLSFANQHLTLLWLWNQTCNLKVLLYSCSPFLFPAW